MPKVDLPATRFGSDQLRQFGPAAFGFLASSDVFFVFDDFVNVLVQLVDVRTIDVDFDEAAFVVDGNGGSVIDRVLNVVDADVVAEDAAGVFVFLVDRRAGEADERGRSGNASRMCLA